MPCRPATSPQITPQERALLVAWYEEARECMTVDLLLRGRTLSFLRWPDGADDHAAYAIEEDGAVLRARRQDRRRREPIAR